MILVLWPTKKRKRKEKERIKGERTSNVGDGKKIKRKDKNDRCNT